MSASTAHPTTDRRRLLLSDLPEALLAELRQAAESAYPAECCGLIVDVAGRLSYWPCANIAPALAQADRFVLAPAEWAAAEDAGTVLAVVHSHPDACANPSMADRLGCERTGLTWFIVGWPSAVIVALQPDGWQAPLVGREFVFGVLDCYTLIQDYYRRELALTLPDFDREDGFWETKRLADGSVQRGRELYLEGFAEAGFVEVTSQPQLHDVILMQVASEVVNHGAVYIGDGLILHHLYGRLSCRDPYGGYWLRHSVKLLRHQSLMAGAPA